MQFPRTKSRIVTRSRTSTKPNSHRESTLEVEIEYTLNLEADGTFSLSLYVWDTMAGGGLYAGGRWTRAGDTLTFEVTENPNAYPRVPTTATAVGDSLDVAGFGTFDP